MLLLLFLLFQIGRLHYPLSKRDLIYRQAEQVDQPATWRHVAAIRKSLSSNPHDTHDDLSYTQIRMTTAWPSRTTPSNSRQASDRWEHIDAWYHTRTFLYSRLTRNSSNTLSIRWVIGRRVASQTPPRPSQKRAKMISRLESTTTTRQQVPNTSVELIAIPRTMTYQKAGKKWKKVTKRITGIYGLEPYNMKDQQLWWYVILVEFMHALFWVIPVCIWWMGGGCVSESFFDLDHINLKYVVLDINHLPVNPLTAQNRLIIKWKRPFLSALFSFEALVVSLSHRSVFFV